MLYERSIWIKGDLGRAKMLRRLPHAGCSSSIASSSLLVINDIDTPSWNFLRLMLMLILLLKDIMNTSKRHFLCLIVLPSFLITSVSTAHLPGDSLYILGQFYHVLKLIVIIRVNDSCRARLGNHIKLLLCRLGRCLNNIITNRSIQRFFFAVRWAAHEWVNYMWA